MLESKTSCFSGGCSSGALPFLWHRRQLGRKAKKILAPAIKELNQEAPNILANISLPPAVTFADINPLDGDYLEFESRKGIIEKILEQLKDSTVRMVGLHGPSGVGKTSLVKRIAKQAGDSKLFDTVVMAIVKKDPDLLKVQQDIADGLRLTFGNIGENGRATLLRKRLKQENTFVILDDLWDELDLNKIGIPFDDDDVVSSHVTSSKKEEEEQRASENSPGSSGTSKRGCKILVTSRYKEVLLGKMNVKEKLISSVPKLDEKDTLTLFKKVVEMSNEIPKFNPETLHNYCAGLPMAVIIVGRWLMKKNKLEWEGELERLKNQQGSNEVHRYMENSVKMGYDHLESEELKSIFLVCAQMYHQSLIVDLVKYCYGLGILNDVHTLRGARQSISQSIQMLKNSGLLDSSTSNDNFNMHDIVRDAALSIACKNQNVFTLRNKTLDVWPHKEQLERYSAIYLHKCHIVDGLPERVNCPRLTFFYIDCDDSTLKIPDTFFEGMEELRVLVLSGIHLQSLPSSIKCLPNLRMLCLEKCTLRDLSVLNHLRKLRILSLSGSRIEDWPTHLDGLSKLQFLDISNCFISSSTRSLSLSSFPNLEELYIENSLTKMEVEGQINHSQISALSELKHLHQLNTLDAYIPSAELLPADLFFDELNDYKIVIGDFETISIGDFKMPKKYEASRSLALQLEPGLDIHSLKGVKLLFKGVVNFLLGELHGVQNVFYELNLNGFPDLKHFSIVNNNDIEYIVNSTELSQPHDAFPSLEFLSLFNLKNIKKICCSPITNSSFSRLKIIKVKMCPQLKSIFFFYIVEFLTSLETIDVSECDSLQAVISKEEGSNKVVLHKLCSLTLQKLPSFVSFYNNADMPLEPESMEKQARINDDIGIVPAEDEQSSTTSFSLFDENVEIPNLESLKLFSIKIHSIWSDRISNDWFQNLIKLTLVDCNLTYLCSLSMARSLNKLKSISISKCSLMEKLFISKENNNEYSKDCIFPKLEEIQLSGMEMLKEIWPCENEVRADSFSSLISVDISHCNKIDKIFPSHMKCCYLSLKSLKVYSCEWVEFIFESRLPPQQSDANKSALLEVIHLGSLPYLKQVWSEDPKGVVNFTNVQSIEISSCNTLSNVLPASIAKDLGKLESFSIQYCDHLEEIIACDGGSETTLKFPEVVSMSFRDLPSIQCFYKGRHIVECPNLKQLTMIECPNLEIFKTESVNEEERAFLSVEKVNLLFQSLEKLSFNMRGVKLTWELKSQVLEFGYSEKRVDMLFEEKPKADYVELLWHLALKGLSISSLHKLKSIGLDHSWIHPILDNIQTLEVKWCLDIKNLVASKVSFSSLTKLVVYHCNALLYVFTSSTAETLSQLKHMEIRNCTSMREIICKEDDESNENIIFEQLQVLHLDELPMLRWLYSGKRTLCFPALQQLFMFGEFWRMTTFCPHIHIMNLNSLKLRSGQGWIAYEVQWEDDVDTTIRKMNNKKILLRESLYFQEMWRASLPLSEACFSNLESLVVHQCDFLSEVIPANLLPFLNNMRKLEVQKCSFVKTIFDVKCITKDRTLLPIKFLLKELVLEKLPNLDSIWNEDPGGVLQFQRIQQVRVDTCKSLTSLFPKSIGKDLVNLKTLELKHCKSLVEIMAGIKTTPERAISNPIKFLLLTSLTLLDLPSLNCFYCSLHCILLKTLNGHDPQIEDQVCFKEVTPKLTNMLFGEREAKMIGHEECEGSHFGDINVPDMQSFNVELESDELPYRFLQKVSCIKTLQVKNSSIKEIFCSKRPSLDCTQFLPHLKELKLASLSELISIGFEHSWIRESSILKTLVTLEVRSCSGLTSLVSSPVYFSNLTHLIVSKCDSMIYLFTSATTKSLTQLKKIEISNCKSMQWIVSNEGEESLHDEIVFEQLQELQFESLENLRRFYNGGFTLSFPSLEQLKVFKCNRMEIFCEGTINTNKLSAGFFKYGDATPLEVDLNSTLRNIYRTEVARFVREVEELKLSEHSRIHGIWNAPFRVPSFCFIRLKILIVEKCEFTCIVIPSHILSLLCKLEELVVRQCDSVKAIFEVTHEVKDTNINSLRSRLKKLTIEQLLNLEHVWDSDPTQQISYFQSFQEVYVQGCNNLQRLFPTSVAENLNKLEKLGITECDRLEEIVAKDEADVEGAPKEFALQSMTSIKLLSLPELKCFYPAPHKLECPKLEEVHLFHCDKVNTFECVSQRYQHPQAENQAIFLSEKVIPNLKFLALSKEEIMMMWHEQFHVNGLSKLEALQLQCFHDDSDTFPYEVLRQLPNIENLAVNCSSFKEIFYSQSPNMDDGKGILPHLKCLQLIKLSKLKSIGLEHAWMDLISKNLEKLLIDQCHCLRSIVPSKLSFSSLIELNISECNGLVSLFTPSTSRTLHQLKNMSVKDCESLEEIVSKETEESSELVEEEIIVFHKLKTLSLCSLPNLGKFYNGNIALKFPLLDKFSLIDCQKMESFCAGAVSVNRWTEVEFKKNKKAVLLEVDLNCAVQQAFEGMFY